MGRAKLALKCIENDRNRRLTFIRRREGLKKKIEEFSSTFDDVEACLLVYDGNDNGQQPMIWPEDSTKVCSIIEKYERQKDEKALEDFHLQDFYKYKNNMVKAEISKVKKEIRNIKYPTWDPSFTGLGVGQVGSFIAMLDAKIKDCDQRINMMKSMNQIEEDNFNSMQNMAQLEGASSNQTRLSFMQKISQGQHIPASMKPANHNDDGVVDLTNQVEVILVGSANHEHVDGAIQHDKSGDCANQIGVLQVTENQLDKAVNKVGDPGEFEDWANQLDDLKDWTWANQLGDSMEWASEIGDLENWGSKLGEPDNWTSQSSDPKD